jgi:hypothetical protein
MVGNQCHNVGLIIHHQYALGDGARFCHALNLPGLSASRQPTKRHERLTQSLRSLLAIVVLG